MPTPQQANVRSVEVLDAFRANLIVYVSRARSTLEEVSSDVLRARLWIEDDHRIYWEGQLRRRAKALEAAQQALFGARLSILDQQSSAEQMAVHRARRAVEEAEAKLRVLKRWARDFDGCVQPLVKQVEKLHTVLSNDLTKAVAELTQTINTLAAYAEIRAPAEPPPAAASEGASAEPKESGGAA
jgi:hypothetical protein